MNKRSIMLAGLVIVLLWLPWLLARILGRPRDIVIRCDGGEAQTPAVTTETEEQ